MPDPLLEAFRREDELMAQLRALITQWREWGKDLRRVENTFTASRIEDCANQLAALLGED